MTDYAYQIQRLSELGPRYSGNDAHRTLIDDVASELSALGYTVERDAHSFERWDVADGGGALKIGEKDVTVSSAWPYSGETGPQGATAQLTLVTGLPKNWAAAAGKIAVISSRWGECR